MVLVRHGESTWNREHRIQGQSDPPLSAGGLRQAELLAVRLARREFSGFYTSDLRRASQTAEAIGAISGQAPEPMQSLREIQLGAWEGLTTGDIATRFPDAWAKWLAQPDWDVVPGGEGAQRFSDRVGATVEDIFRRHPKGDTLVVTHGGVIQIALHRILGRAGHGLFPFRIQNASISVIESRNGRIVISGVNDIAHLEAGPISDVGPG